MKPTPLSGLLLGILFLVTACTTSISIPPEKQCSHDYDCVPLECCHPLDAVNKGHARDCTGLLCTMECVPATIDCGQGEIKCVEGACTVINHEA